MLASRVEDLPVIAGPGERVLRGDRPFRLLPFLGPAFVACVAYIDPGNFATNIAGGSKYGYTLLWVIVASNLMAMLIQTLFPAAVITGVAAFAILGLQQFGFRPLEATIAALVGVIGLAYLGELVLADPPLGTVAKHAGRPRSPGRTPCSWRRGSSARPSCRT